MLRKHWQKESALDFDGTSRSQETAPLSVSLRDRAGKPQCRRACDEFRDSFAVLHSRSLTPTNLTRRNTNA